MSHEGNLYDVLFQQQCDQVRGYLSRSHHFCDLPHDDSTHDDPYSNRDYPPCGVAYCILRRHQQTVPVNQNDAFHSHYRENSLHSGQFHHA